MTDFPALWKVQTASGTHKLVLMAIGYFSRRDGVCYARRSTIAKATCLHLKSVDAAIAALSKAGFLSLEKNYEAGKGQRPARIMLTIQHREDWELDPFYAPHGPVVDDPLMADHGGEHNPRSTGEAPRAERVTSPAQNGSHIERLTSRLIDRKSPGAGAPDPSLFEDDVTEAHNLWNAMAERTGLPKTRGFTAARKAHLKTRIQEHGLATWKNALGLVEGSKLLLGQGRPRQGSETPWRASFDWLCNAANFLKVIEGTYAQDAKPKGMTALQVDSFQDKLRTDPAFGRTMAHQWTQDPDRWPPEAGPPPGQPGCVLPMELQANVVRSMSTTLPLSHDDEVPL